MNVTVINIIVPNWQNAEWRNLGSGANTSEARLDETLPKWIIKLKLGPLKSLLGFILLPLDSYFAKKGSASIATASWVFLSQLQRDAYSIKVNSLTIGFIYSMRELDCLENGRM